jgi:hypothetical protein
MTPSPGFYILPETGSVTLQNMQTAPVAADKDTFLQLVSDRHGEAPQIMHDLEAAQLRFLK